MKTLMIFPPQWHPANPYLSIPLFVGQLKKNGYVSECWDLNVDFYNDVLNQKYLQKSLDKAQNILNNTISTEISEMNDSTIEEKILIQKYDIISNFLKNKQKKIDRTLKYIDNSVNILKSEDFYNPELLYKSQLIISDALEIVSLPYAPSVVAFENYYNPLFNFSYKDIKYQCFNPDINIFIDYFKDKIKQIPQDIELIGISCAGESQVVPTLTLCKILKQNTNAKIVIGGNLISRITDTICSYPELFDIFFDFVITGDGENSIVELADALSGKNKLENVSQLLYKNQSNKVIHNSIKNPIIINNIAPLSLDGLDLKKYFTPELVLLMQLSKGCYWGKCAFCDFSYEKSYDTKKTEHVIQEIKDIQKRYGISKYRFADDAIHPEYYDILADSLLKAKLKIDYYSFARFDLGFNEKLFKKLHKSGLRMLQWGFESASDRLLKFMNKGTENIDKVKILKDAKKSKISNYLFLLLGFPTESLEEAHETINFIKENFNLIHYYSISQFYLQKQSKIKDCYEEFGLNNLKNTEEFATYYTFNSEDTINSQINEIKKIYRNKFAKDESNQYTLTSILFSDYLFLYICKYGNDFVKKYKFSSFT